MKEKHMSVHAALGELIATLRKSRGMTQLALAKAIATSQSAVARMERGEQNVSMAMLQKVSKVLRRPLVQLAGDATSFRIEGGKPLHGTVTMSASKNAAVGLLAASLLNRGVTTLERVPRIEEVHRLIEVMQSIGVRVEWKKNGDVRITPPKKLNLKHLDLHAAQKTRSIILFMGPLMHLFDRFALPYAGGCKLGTRTVRPHLYALEALGAKIAVKDDHYDVWVPKRTAGDIVLYESGDTVTENALFAAARMHGATVIRYASANYMVQDVCFYLQKLGVRIEGVGTTTLTVYGVPDIDVDVTYAPSEDPIEAMSFIAAGIVTHSAITIKRCPIRFLELELLHLAKMGFLYKITKRYVARNGQTELVDIETRSSKLTAVKEAISPRPYAGINADNFPFFVLVASVASGRTLIHDWMYDN
ncbi:helix-turn-helix domain-containing protein, partial [Candidatus Uhrbacteria bacterium]|nr:helix-turn-helix domain-containing protein [Candidatus Uhrbacteria bacterium]